MSLRGFHIFFISISALLAAGLGMMTMRTFLEQHAMSQLGWSVLSFAAAISLVVYGVRMRRKLRDFGLLVAILVVTGVPQSAWACATCFGDPESPQTRAMNVAILFMLGIVATLLSSFAAFFVHLRMCAKRVAGEFHGGERV